MYNNIIYTQKFEPSSHHKVIAINYSFRNSEIILVTNYINGNNLDTIIFKKECLKDVRIPFCLLYL